MRFRSDHELFDTHDMITIELEVTFLILYLYPSRGMAFLQTFEEERGVVIRRLPVEDAMTLLELHHRTNSPDIHAYRAVVENILNAKPSPHRLRRSPASTLASQK